MTPLIRSEAGKILDAPADRRGFDWVPKMVCQELTAP